MFRTSMTEQYRLLGTSLTGIILRLTARSQFRFKTKLILHNGSRMLLAATVKIQNTKDSKPALLVATAIFQ